MELLLFVTDGSSEAPQQHRFPEPERLTLGRGPQSPVLLDGPAVSREHLTLDVRDGELWATDVSSNGSWINGRTMQSGAPQRVGAGDEIRIGDYLLRFRLERDEPVPAPPDADPPKAAAEAAPAAAPPPPLSLVKAMLSGVTFLEWTALAVILIAAALISVWWLR
ncbi:MAG: FHA domain-containing protein [Acidobacteria bacterium]|nr:FHA domain-containing protein [Acidobacteriota bacterium]